MVIALTGVLCGRSVCRGEASEAGPVLQGVYPVLEAVWAASVRPRLQVPGW